MEWAPPSKKMRTNASVTNPNEEQPSTSGNGNSPPLETIEIDGVIYILEDISDDEEVETEPLSDEVQEDLNNSRRKARWERDEKCALFLASNSRRHILRGSFQGPGGGKALKDNTWQEIADYVNKVSKTSRTAEDCKKKASNFASEAKAKFNRLKAAWAQTGGGQLDDDEQLTQDEEMALDYVGEEAVTGVPGIVGVPIRRTGKRKVLVNPWNPQRETKPNYLKVAVGKKTDKENLKDIKKQHQDEKRKLAMQKAEKKMEEERYKAGIGKGKGKGKGRKK